MAKATSVSASDGFACPNCGFACNNPSHGAHRPCPEQPWDHRYLDGACGP